MLKYIGRPITDTTQLISSQIPMTLIYIYNMMPLRMSFCIFVDIHLNIRKERY